MVSRKTKHIPKSTEANPGIPVMAKPWHLSCKKPPVTGTSDSATPLLRSESSISTDSYSSSMRGSVDSRGSYEPVSTNSVEGSFNSYDRSSGNSTNFSGGFLGGSFGFSGTSSMTSYENIDRVDMKDSIGPSPRQRTGPHPLKDPNPNRGDFGQQVESPIREEWQSQDMPALLREIGETTEVFKQHSMSERSRDSSNKRSARDLSDSRRSKATNVRKKQSSVGIFGSFQGASNNF